MTMHATMTATQRGVGHGGFHTQKLTLDSCGDQRTFRLIYDCGSNDAPISVAPSIATFLTELDGNDEIDLLVVSHFDRDHVSGLKELSDQLRAKHVRVRRVCVPFLTEIEAVQFIAGHPDDDDLAYILMVTEPVSQFTELFPGATVQQLAAAAFITPADDDDSPDAADDDDDTAVVAISAATGSHSLGMPGQAAVWDVLPYVTQEVSNQADAFYGELRKQPGLSTLPKNRNDFSPGNLAVFIHTHQKVLRAAGRAVGLQPNQTSICLYSGPRHSQSTSWNIRLRWSAPTGNTVVIPTRRHAGAAWLATGDAPLGTIRAVRALQKFYGARLSHVRVLGAPHHGSAKDARRQLWRSLGNVRAVTLHANGKSHHPSRQLVVDLLQDRIQPLLVNRHDLEIIARTTFL